MKKNGKGKWDMEPQKSSAAQYLTYIASYGISDEKFEIRYEDENIWMSQKMLAAVYGIEVALPQRLRPLSPRPRSRGEERKGQRRHFVRVRIGGGVSKWRSAC